MKLLVWLLRLVLRNTVKRKSAHQLSPVLVARAKAMTVAAPPGYKWLTPPGPPKTEGRTEKQRAADLARYLKKRRSFGAGRAAFNRKRSMRLGIVEYVWLSSGGGPDCDIADRNNGKRFRWDTPPPEGHPAEGECHATDWCRCVTRPIIPGLAR